MVFQCQQTRTKIGTAHIVCPPPITSKITTTVKVGGVGVRDQRVLHKVRLNSAVLRYRNSSSPYHYIPTLLGRKK